VGTYLPAAIHPAHAKEPKIDMATAMVEADAVMGGAVSDLLAKTGLRPQDVDILVTNCSIFCPTPSLASMLINKFKFRQDVQAYNLGGMGCSIGVVAVGLVRDLLQAHPDANLLFVPAEVTTYCFYQGGQRDFMVANAIFRMGGAASYFTNRPAARRTAKYALEHSVRVHTGQADAAYRCINWGPDKDGINGVYLGKDVPQQAGKMLEAVVKAITPKIMTWGQWLQAASVVFQRRTLGWKNVPYFVPDYTACCDHFALHAGGYAVLKGIMTGMNLPVSAVMPSFAALRDYGNTSSSTTWYTMAYLESQALVRRGHRVMQVGAGGGMKGGVNVWRALRDLSDVHPAWRHCAGRPYVEADLPRRIYETPEEEATALARQAAIKAGSTGAARRAARAAGGVAKRQVSMAAAVQHESELESKDLGVAAL
jgi:3-ketoacyl-CoA synthase